jgi:hypothetical protein
MANLKSAPILRGRNVANFVAWAISGGSKKKPKKVFIHIKKGKKKKK